MRIKDFFTWDTLNKAAILVTLLTALAAFFAYIGSQAVSVIILISTSSAALLLVLFRSFKFRHELQLKNSTLNEVFGISKDLTVVILKAKKQAKKLKTERSNKRQNLAKVLLKKCLNSLSKSATDYSGNTCVVSCSILEDVGIDEGHEVLVRTIAQSDNIGHQPNNNIDLPFLKSIFIRTLMEPFKPILIKDINKDDLKYHTVSPEMKFQSAAIAPILDNDGKLLGFLSLDSTNKSAFNKDILPVLEFYSDWCSIILLEILDDLFAEHDAAR